MYEMTYTVYYISQVSDSFKNPDLCKVRTIYFNGNCKSKYEQNHRIMRWTKYSIPFKNNNIVFSALLETYQIDESSNLITTMWNLNKKSKCLGYQSTIFGFQCQVFLDLGQLQGLPQTRIGKAN